MERPKFVEGDEMAVCLLYIFFYVVLRVEIEILHCVDEY